MKQQTELNRGLEERHITLMSLGAAIGVGLFFGISESDSTGRTRYIDRLLNRRHHHLHHHAGTWGARCSGAGIRQFCRVCTKVCQSVSRIPDRLELLVALDLYMYGGNHGSRDLHARMVPEFTDLDVGTWCTHLNDEHQLHCR